MEMEPLYSSLTINRPNEISKLKQKLCFIVLYLAMLTPSVLCLAYIIMVTNRLKVDLNDFNKTSIESYLVKLEHIVDYICDNQNICGTINY